MFSLPTKVLFSFSLYALAVFVAFNILAHNNKANTAVLEPIKTKIINSSQTYQPTVLGLNTHSTDIAPLISNIKTKQGEYAFFIKDLKTNETFAYNEQNIMPAASLYKILVAAGLLKKYNPLPNQIKVATESLLKNSDNEAQEYLQSILGESNLVQSAIDLNLDSNFYTNTNTTAKQTAELIANLYTSDFLNGDSKDFLFTTLKSTSFDDRIHLGLDKNLEFAHKIGTLGDVGVFNDCGIILEKEVVVCLLSQNTNEKDFLEIATQIGKSASDLD